MLKTFFQIILFIPFVVVFFLFAILGRLAKRLDTFDFPLRKTVVGIIRVFATVGVLFTEYVGKLYE